MTYPRISVIVPTCDRPELLEKAISSLFSQSTLPYEIIIVNNGLLSIDSFAKHKELKIINFYPYAGVSQARNLGSFYAKGDYLAFLDDDDEWEMGYIEKVKNVIEGEQPDLIYTRLDRFNNEMVVPFKDATKVKSLFQSMLITNPGIGGSNIIIKKATFFELGGYKPYLITSEDRALIIDSILKNKTIRGCSHIQAICNSTDNSLSNYYNLYLGKKMFYWKYSNYMNIYQKFKNLSKIYFSKYKHFHSGSSLILFAIYYLMGAIIKRLRSYD